MRVRNPNWLKASILYWDSIRRFCPAGYRLRESQVDSQLTETGFLKNVNPEFYSADISNELLAFMQENIEFLRNRFSVLPAAVPARAAAAQDGKAAGMAQWLGNEAPWLVVILSNHHS